MIGYGTQFDGMLELVQRRIARKNPWLPLQKSSRSRQRHISSLVHTHMQKKGRMLMMRSWVVVLSLCYSAASTSPHVVVCIPHRVKKPGKKDIFVYFALIEPFNLHIASRLSLSLGAPDHMVHASYDNSLFPFSNEHFEMFPT